MFTYLKTLGKSIYISGYDSKGKKYIYEDKKYKPYYFIPVQKETNFKSFPGNQNLTKYICDSIYDYKERIDNTPKNLVWGNIPNIVDIQYIRENRLCENYDLNNLKVFFFDIEVISSSGFPTPNEANHPITAISLQDRKTKKIYVWSLAPEYVPEKDVIHYAFYDESEMLKHFAMFISKEQPDVLSGWNTDNFDIPYLYNRYKRLNILNSFQNMSPFNMVLDRQEKLQSGDILNTCQIVGIQQMDYLVLYKNYTQNKKESYKLGLICEEELGEGKVDYSEEKDLTSLWINNKQKFMEYNIKDTKLLTMLDEVKGFIDLAFSLCYYAKANISEFESNTKLWCAKLYNELLDRGLVMPSSRTESGNGIVGAYVKEPIPGLHKWVVSFDVTSLYPSIIRQMNISWETYLGKIDNFDIIDKTVEGTFDFSDYKKRKITLCPFGSMFSTEKKGIAVELMETLFFQRKKHNKESKRLKAESKKLSGTERENTLNESRRLHNIQFAEKILLNSFYGALTFDGFPLYKKELGESITSFGQVAIRYCSKHLNNFFNQTLKTKEIDYNIYNDTDSGYFECDGFVKLIQHKNPSIKQTVDYLDNLSSKMFEPKIKEIFQNMFEYMSCYENIMDMKREIIAESALWVAKKRYAALVWDSEGDRYETPKMKIMGMQIVRSDTPKAVKPFLKDGVMKILKEEPIHSFIDEVKQKIFAMASSEIAILKGVNNIKKYSILTSGKITGYKKGEEGATPIHIRASILHNILISNLKLDKKYQLIKDGDKVKFCYLKTPNPIGENIIGFIDEMPNEFGLAQYIDYDTMYDKLFKSVVGDICEAAGIELDLQKKVLLDIMF